ncbi:FUSC family protein, partial [Streptomyces fungicidicus]
RRRAGCPSWLRCVHACTAQTAARLAGTAGADPAPTVAELEQLLARVRLSVAPLVHPLNPMLGRKRRARRVLGLLDDCAREIRGLVAVAADPEASHDARLAAACRRVEAAVEALTGGRDLAARTAPAGTGPALAHLHGLERALAELAAPLRAPSGSPLVGA